MLAAALARARVHGVRTNRDLLVNVLRHPAFLDGATDTAFFDTHGLASCRRRWPTTPTMPAVGDRRRARRRRAQPRDRTGARVDSQRLAQPGVGHQVKTYRDDAGDEHRVDYRFSRTGLVLPDDRAVHLVVGRAPDEVVLRRRRRRPQLRGARATTRATSTSTPRAGRCT